MPPSLDNPFRKPPRSKKEAEEVSELLTGKERKGVKDEKGSRIELNRDEQEIIDNEPWTRKQMEEWAKKFNLNDEWIDEHFTYNEEGKWTSTEGLLNLSFVEIPKDIPKGIVGVGILLLEGLQSVEGIVFPESPIHIYLNGLKSAEHLVLPKGVLEVFLNNLETTDQLVLPASLIHVELNSFTKVENLKLPKSLKSIDLNSLKTTEGLELPDNYEGSIMVQSLTSDQKEALQERYPNAKIQ